MAVKISPHHHSLLLKPHEHTSYGLLALIVVLVGIVLAGLTVNSYASAGSGTGYGSVSLTGTVPEAPPVSAATITEPTGSQVFSSTPVTVSGSCPADTLIEIFKNNIFAGSAPCSSADTYTLQIDLLYGANSLTAVDYDVLNQAGPSSTSVSVFYNAVPPPISSLLNVNFTGTQLILNTTAVYRGTFPGQTLNVPITIIGGVGPFAMNIEWGDDTNQVLPSSQNATVNASHIYKRPGTYKIIIQASDSQGRIAFLTVAAIVNGQPVGTAAGSTNKPSASKLLVLWPLYAIAATVVISFWLGERREKRVLEPKLHPLPTLGQLSPPHH